MQCTPLLLVANWQADYVSEELGFLSSLAMDILTNCQCNSPMVEISYVGVPGWKEDLASIFLGPQEEAFSSTV